MLCVYAMAMNSRKRKVLSLRERVVVLSKIDSGKSCQSVAGEIGAGETQTQGIVRDREYIIIRIGHEEPEHSRRDHVERDKNSQTN